MSYPQNFTIANKFTQKWEKGYVNHKNDPGGATYNGVSLRFLKQTGIDINGDGKIDIEDILDLYRRKDQAKVDEIFFKAFWRDPALDRLPSPHVQAAVYDSNVNAGRTQSAKFLQRACNALADSGLKVDGAIGPLSLGAVKEICAAKKGLDLALKFVDKRMDFHNRLVANSPYKDGRNYKPFAAGWRNRCDDLRRCLRGMAE